jgi:amino acid adenylation domain-containing protein
MKRRLHDALEVAAALHPDKTGVFLRDRKMTYSEWDSASNRLARALREAGCQRGDRVGLLLPKSLEALIGMFGALKADCAYVPLDTASPAARLARILESADCRCVLAVESTSTLLNALIRGHAIGTPAIGWMDDGAELEDCNPARFSWRDVQSLPDASSGSSASDERDLAHILYTSGTTGVPKGVMITHFNVMQFVDWSIRRFGMDSGDRISGHPPFHFDLSTFDIHGTVAAGAELHLVPPELNLLPARLADFIRNAGLTQWFSVPSILTHMAKSDAIRWHDFPALRRLLWCGEKFPTPALIHWMRRLPQVSFFNLYGPTETTIASSCCHIAECPQEETAEIPIGKACDGEQLLLLDEKLEPTADGEMGDLYISGVGLSPGYWRDTARTAAAFVTSPFEPGAPRIYKTGDLARRGRDSQIYLSGRSDAQIKSRGYRIELGEIEAALYAQPEVRDAAVVAIESSAFEGTEICCAWVPAAGFESTPVIPLKRRLADLLPAYMLPAHWMVVDRMPLNGNGKTDRPCLRERFRQTIEENAGSFAPAGRHQQAQAVCRAPERQEVRAL